MLQVQRREQSVQLFCLRVDTSNVTSPLLVAEPASLVDGLTPASRSRGRGRARGRREKGGKETHDVQEKGKGGCRVPV